MWNLGETRFASDFVIFVCMGRCVYVQSKMAPHIVLRASVRNNRLQLENVSVQIDLGACLTQSIALARPLIHGKYQTVPVRWILYINLCIKL